MTESLRDKLRRWKFNLLPSYRGSGAWITYLAADWREVKIKLPLNLWTRNYVGTTFCGSMYAAVAPMYMAMIALNLGTGYLVWDKSVTINFIRPGRGPLYAHFLITAAELDGFKAVLETQRSLEHTYAIDLTDDQGVVHVSFEELLYIRRQRPAKSHTEG